MSYRNDHDAALQRVDALEREIAQLRAMERAPAPRRAPATGRGRSILAILGVASCALIGGLATAWALVEERPAPVAPEGHEPAALVAPMSDDACQDQIAAWAVRDAAAADPRGMQPRSTTYLLAGPRPCGAQTQVPSPEEQNVSSLITVYYDNDPVALDGYGTAEQLWREYHRARARR